MLRKSLNITEQPKFDHSIARKEFTKVLPFTNSFKNNDVINLTLNSNSENLFLPAQSEILIETTFTKTDGTAFAAAEAPSFIAGSILFAFQSISYSLNGVEIDRCKNLGQSVMLKAFSSYTDNEMKGLTGAGFKKQAYKQNANFSIPVKTLFGLFETFDKPIIAGRHQFILVRSKSDENCFKCDNADTTFKFEITKVSLMACQITLSDAYKLKYYDIINAKKDLIMPFRSWEMIEVPELTATTHQIIPIKTSTLVETPRFLIIGFQTARDGVKTKTSSYFDHISLEEIKVHLNNVTTEALDIDFDKDKYQILYNNFSQFRANYYQIASEILPTPSMSYEEFKSNTIIVLDTQYQPDSITPLSTVDVKIEFRTKVAIPAKTSLFCLILSDRIFKYTPLTGQVLKLS